MIKISKLCTEINLGLKPHPTKRCFSTQPLTIVADFQIHLCFKIEKSGFSVDFDLDFAFFHWRPEKSFQFSLQIAFYLVYIEMDYLFLLKCPLSFNCFLYSLPIKYQLERTTDPLPRIGCMYSLAS